ncbi:hypothetical protein [Stygiolobus caldivivus]|uniref:Uncharacterized protein n=1 Tax=Stygiolobus caldivivus TaxID=2824673 RepID=A0A8D5ZKN4_9CREN|nr:hypothetical protein [Stygiolobus caldivivus]BCU71462.1 hypothetical protein KN1_27590 [Stygiolobus caldivivus]
MITITLNSDRFTVLHFLQDHRRVMKAFDGFAITKEGVILWKGKEFHLTKKEVSLFDVTYNLSRTSILGRNDITIRFSVLPKNSFCLISVNTEPRKLESMLNEKKFREEFDIFQSESLALSKPVLAMSVSREKIPEVLELAISKSVGQVLLLWFSSNDDKYVRIKLKNGELIEKIGDFEDISSDSVNVIVKQIAIA